ncbi:hypothetical protein E2320_002208 [Naja naja]|nr:hypothetical protein E2320_002208 [Naja naja]
MSRAIATRTNSCQSSNSGFLEDLLEPLPLQVLSLPITMRSNHNFHDYQEFSQCNPSEENNFKGDEIFYSINEDIYETYSGQSKNIVRKSAYMLDKNEIQDRRGQEKEDDCLVQDSTSAPEKNNIDLDKVWHVPDSEKNANSFKSVTMQMPSKLTSNKQSISPSETAIKDLSVDLSSKKFQFPRNESMVLSANKQTREDSAEIHGKQRKKPCPHFTVSLLFMGMVT